jgi:hypothetical protein
MLRTEREICAAQQKEARQKEEQKHERGRAKRKLACTSPAVQSEGEFSVLAERGKRRAENSYKQSRSAPRSNVSHD